jgi:hypothetical protein
MANTVKTPNLVKLFYLNYIQEISQDQVLMTHFVTCRKSHKTAIPDLVLRNPHIIKCCCITNTSHGISNSILLTRPSFIFSFDTSLLFHLCEIQCQSISSNQEKNINKSLTVGPHWPSPHPAPESCFS